MRQRQGSTVVRGVAEHKGVLDQLPIEEHVPWCDPGWLVRSE
jgi:hypothetical protein